jgi:hypothetical protein
LWPNIRFLPLIVAEKNGHNIQNVCSMCIKINKVGKQEVGIWWAQKRFPWYGVPIWSLWPNIRFLPSIVAENNATKNEHIHSMCIKINKVGKQEVGIWRVQKRYPQYGIPIWRLWPNIRFLPSTVTEKNVTKNILDWQTDRGKTVYPPPTSGSGVYKNVDPPYIYVPLSIIFLFVCSYIDEILLSVQNFGSNLMFLKTKL